MQSKAERIRDLLEKTDMTAREIAVAVGCLDAYVRVVQHRLAAGGLTASDANWRRNNQDKQRAIWRDGQRRLRAAKKAARALEAA